MKIFQKGFNYSQDGDGNRLVYHMQGCNLKCPWCANPEGMQCKERSYQIRSGFWKASVRMERSVEQK